MNIDRIAVNNGVFSGVVLITFTLVLSFVNPEVFLKSKSFLLLIPFVLILIKNASDIRREAGGYIEYKTLFLQGFVCAAIAVFMCSCFEFLLFNYIYPELEDIYKRISIEALEHGKTMFGEEFIEDKIALIENQKPYSLTAIFSLFIWRLVAPGALFAFITAAIMKKSKPTIKS